MLMARDNGFQSCLMAPTEILAEQHYKKMCGYAEPLGLKVAILVGGQKKKVRTAMLEMVASGEADITVGTHALIEDTVKFKNLGLTVVDEQHKFGVMQRAKLWQKANPYPHNMVMTATPIPRTLAMTLYGDIDVSVIDELPPGRVPIKTVWRGESKRLQMFEFVRNELEKGKQAYVVYPLVEESEKLDYLAAIQGKEVFEKYFKDYRVGLVHGRMKAEDKEVEMQFFVQNKSQILVSTTVIEVGVDVPNATIMVIENAEKFGLSQLHQLRGRVGRNAEQSYCILMSGAKVSKEGKARLQAMVDSTDGFKIAETDLKLRGPGDFLGTRQSGLPEFQLANIAEDQEILQAARDAAFGIFEKDPHLNLPANRSMAFFYEEYKRQYARFTTMA
jgi:ATP-dependent DNA helicase RecG